MADEAGARAEKDVEELQRRADEVKDEVDRARDDLDEVSLTETEGQPYYESGEIRPDLDDQTATPFG
jgi:hypothetical protein